MNKAKEVNLRREFRRNNMFNFSMAVLFSCTLSIITIFTAYIFKRMMEIAIDGSLADLKGFVLMTVIYIMVYVTVVQVNKFFKNRYLYQAGLQYKNKIFAQVMNQQLNMENSVAINHYQSGLTMDMESIEQNIILGDIEIIDQVVMFVCGLATMFYLSLTITLLLIVMAVIPALVSMYYNRRLPLLEREVSDRNANFIAILADLLAGFSVIKVFKVEREASEQFAEVNANLEEAKIARRSKRINLNLGMFVSSYIVTCVLGGVGIYLVLTDRVTIGVVVAFIQLMDYVVNPIEALGKLNTNRKAAAKLITKMEEIISQEQSVAEQTHTKNLNVTSIGDLNSELTVKSSTKTYTPLIEFDEVSLKLAESGFELKGINLKLEHNQHYLIIGPSGSGKSTLLKLIMSYYSDYQGKILIDGHNQHSYSLAELYSKIAYVQQTTFIFNDTLEHNIGLYRSHNAVSVEHALAVSGLKSIMDSRGPDYECGIAGKALSGGEKQRVALARAFLVQPQLLLLDEATSALDENSNREIMRHIFAQENLTSISIMHRVDQELIQKFDRIIVLAEGRILFYGSYAELVAEELNLFNLL